MLHAILRERRRKLCWSDGVRRWRPHAATGQPVFLVLHVLALRAEALLAQHGLCVEKATAALCVTFVGKLAFLAARWWALFDQGPRRLLRDRGSQGRQTRAAVQRMCPATGIISLRCFELALQVGIAALT